MIEFFTNLPTILKHLGLGYSLVLLFMFINILFGLYFVYEVALNDSREFDLVPMTKITVFILALTFLFVEIVSFQYIFLWVNHALSLVGGIELIHVVRFYSSNNIHEVYRLLTNILRSLSINIFYTTIFVSIKRGIIR